jgi:hypothetical protein
MGAQHGRGVTRFVPPIHELLGKGIGFKISERGRHSIINAKNRALPRGGICGSRKTARLRS